MKDRIIYKFFSFKAQIYYYMKYQLNNKFTIINELIYKYLLLINTYYKNKINAISIIKFKQ